MSLTRALETAVAAVLAAGRILRAEFHRDGGPRGGAGKAPADTEAELEIRRRLVEAFPGWGYLGEETGEAPAEDDESCVWVVDPNDGTASYLRGQRGSTVSVALLRDAVPVLGALYAFAAPDDRGDLFGWAEGCGPPTRNGEPLAQPTWSATPGPLDVVLLSDRADSRPGTNASLVAPARYRAQESIAYRLALVAAGEGGASVSVNSPGAWDYAAGHALLRATGGVLVDERGREVTYSHAGHSRTQFCFGGGARLVADLATRDWDALRRAPKAAQEPYDLVRLEPGFVVADPDLLSRAQGCLLGQLAGDSLGSLVEFRTAGAIRRDYPDGVRRLARSDVWGTLAGQPTDDSELALMLARSIVRTGGYDPEASAQAYHFWFRSRPFDCGSTIRSALSGIRAADAAAGRAATAAREAANPEPQSNGSLMRASPLGIWGHRLPAGELAEAARTDAALTHPNPVCRDATAAFVVAIAHGVASGEGPGAMHARALEWTASGARCAPVIDALRSAQHDPPADFITHPGWVLVALQNAFYQLLHAPSLEEAVVRTVMSGGDTDTNAAIAGALAGAAHGRAAVPAQWRRMVLSSRPLEGLAAVERPRPRACWPVDALELAERLLRA
jgi:ADP-ribosylglycohydrolase/fructose-1,6-bisphosphatase/inositol monophosphatase family enzyme